MRLNINDLIRIKPGSISREESGIRKDYIEILEQEVCRIVKIEEKLILCYPLSGPKKTWWVGIDQVDRVINPEEDPEEFL